MNYTEIEMEWMKEILRDKEEEIKKLKAELERMNELLSNVARCSEQYRGKMISIMEELKMFLNKD